jgi:GTP:adenosylcobinamide-phosphate guanylyltransferase
MTDQPTILILAGKRDGKLDPLAERAGVSHKCRVPIGGKPLLEWVVEAVGPAFPDAKVLISIHDPAVIADLPGVAALQVSGRLTLCTAQSGIVESVEHAIAEAGGNAAFPLLITTADNVLAESEYLRGARRGDGERWRRRSRTCNARGNSCGPSRWAAQILRIQRRGNLKLQRLLAA